MPGTTTHGYPYPLSSEPISGAAQAIKDMADTCNTKCAISACGKVTIDMGGAAAGTKSVTFPSGRFTTIPQVVGMSGNSLFFASAGALTATGFTAYLRKWNNTADSTTGIPYWYIARA